MSHCEPCEPFPSCANYLSSKLVQFLGTLVTSSTILEFTSIYKHDGYSSKNACAVKQNVQPEQNNGSARASHTSVHFFGVPLQTTENGN